MRSTSSAGDCKKARRLLKEKYRNKICVHGPGPADVRFSARASRSSATKGGDSELGGGKLVIILIIMGVVAGSRQSSHG